MHKERQELHISGQYIQMKKTGECFCVTTMVVNDDNKGSYFITDDGVEVKKDECVQIRIPSLKDFNKILAKYPDALLQKGSRKTENFAVGQDEIIQAYKNIDQEELRLSLEYHIQEVKNIRQVLGISSIGINSLLNVLDVPMTFSEIEDKISEFDGVRRNPLVIQKRLDMLEKQGKVIKTTQSKDASYNTSLLEAEIVQYQRNDKWKKKGKRR